MHFGCWSTILGRLNAFFFKYYRVAFSYCYFCVRICFGIEMYELGWKGPLEIIHMIPAWRKSVGHYRALHSWALNSCRVGDVQPLGNPYYLIVVPVKFVSFVSSCNFFCCSLWLFVLHKSARIPALPSSGWTSIAFLASHCILTHFHNCLVTPRCNVYFVFLNNGLLLLYFILRCRAAEAWNTQGLYDYKGQLIYGKLLSGSRLFISFHWFNLLDMLFILSKLENLKQDVT